MNELEQKTFDELSTTNRLLLQMNKNQREANKNIMKVAIIGFISFALVLISMVIGFFVYESQFEIQDEVTRKEITQEVSGENSNINNVEGNQYNDNATHNE